MFTCSQGASCRHPWTRAPQCTSLAPGAPKEYLLAECSRSTWHTKRARSTEWRAYIKDQIEPLLSKRQALLWHSHTGTCWGAEPLAARRPWAEGSSLWRRCGCTSVAGGSCAQRIQTSKSKACFVPGSRRCNWLHRVHRDQEPGLRGGRGLLQWDEGQKEDSKLQYIQAGCTASANARWGHTSRHVISIPKHNTGNLSPLSQQTVLMRDSRKEHQWLFLLLLVWELYLVWGQHGRTHEVTCRKANISVTWAGAAGVMARQRQSAEMETRMRRPEIWRV